MKNVTFKKILVPHDGSRFASSVQPCAMAIAKLSHAELIFLHVIHPLDYGPPMIDSTGMGMSPTLFDSTRIQLKKIYKKKIIKQLEALKTTCLDEGLSRVSSLIKEGQAENVILDTAKKEHCDMIIMATHGRSGVGRVLLGSVADYVIRHGHCPVLIIRPVHRKSTRNVVKKGGEKV